MSNMSYVRFRNTLRDLQDCSEHMDASDLSDAEAAARQELIELCAELARHYGQLEDAV